MDLTKLKQIGLTEGEIRVYEALIHLGRTSTGKIMKRASISSSKVYLILERLEKKGLVSSIIIDNVQQFQITDPNTIIDYINEKKDELDETRKQMKALITHIRDTQIGVEEESAQFYKGFRGIQMAYLRLLAELTKGETYRIFSIGVDDIKDKKIVDFFHEFHKERIKKDIDVKLIVDSSSFESYKKKNIPISKYEIRHHLLTLPIGMVIGKNRVLTISFDDEIVAHEIISSAIARKYQDYFDKIWDKSRSE